MKKTTASKLLIIFILLCNNLSAQKSPNDFVTTWRTYNSGYGGDSTVVLPMNTIWAIFPPGTFYTVDWENDGIFDSKLWRGTATHHYPDTGTYTIRLKGQFPLFTNDTSRFTPLHPNFEYQDKLISLDQWGNNQWFMTEYMFANNREFTYNAVDTPNLTSVKSMAYMFYNNDKFNADISGWDVSQVESMYATLADCPNYNQPLNSWDVSQVKNLVLMLSGCSNFNQPLNSWNVSQVKFLTSMFAGCSNFNQPLNNWDVSNVQYLGGLFAFSNFNHPINNWAVDSVISMRAMFANNKVFNQALDNWNTTSLKDADYMFSGATTFNQDISNFNFSNISTPQPWTSNPALRGMLDSCGMSVANYDKLLTKLGSYLNLDSIPLGSFGLEYCSGDSSRTALINRGWMITGDTLNCLGVGVRKINLANLNEIEVYPNPAKDFFNLQIENYSAASKISIYNLDGKLVKEKMIDQRVNQISISNLSNGIYFIKYRGNLEKIIVNN